MLTGTDAAGNVNRTHVTPGSGPSTSLVGGLQPGERKAGCHMPCWWYRDGMRTTIDKAGRIVIPAALRDRAGFVAGSEIEISEDDRGLRLERVATGPRLVRIGRRLVARPTVGVDERPVIDIATVVDEERNRWP